MTTTIIELLTAEEAAAAPVASTDGTYVYNPAHVAEGQNKLIEFFKKPRNLSVLNTTLGSIGTQSLEDCVRDFFTKFDLGTAVGDQLDMLGAQVGELRGDRADAAYRLAVQVRILVNASEGSLPELLTIMTTAIPTISVITRETYPAAVLFRWLDAFSTVAPEDLMNLVLQAKPAGVGVQATIRDAAALRFSTVAAAGGATVLAFASTSVGGDGGLAARVL